MLLSSYDIDVLKYFFNNFNKYTSINDAPADIAGTGYRQEFKKCIHQLFVEKLLVKEVQTASLRKLEDKYRISKEGKRVILKSKTDEEIKHVILGFLKTDSEKTFDLDELEAVIPIEREKLIFILGEMQTCQDIITLGQVEENDNFKIIIQPKGQHNYLKSEYLKIKEKTSLTTFNGHTFNITGSNSRFYNNSIDNSNNTANVNSETLFSELTDFIRKNIDENQKLLELVGLMAENKGNSAFPKFYADFIASAANHTTILAPFLPALTAFFPK